jgi:LPXTG-motif cell wall-anchored protein
MRHVALLAAIYALIAALVLPSSLFASEDGDPAVAEAPATETTPAEELPAPEPAPAEPAPPPEPPAPAPEQPAAAPEQPAAAPKPKAKPEPKAVSAASGTVTIADFQFTPAQITVDQGDTVTWSNSGPSAHSATATGGSFDTGIMPAGQSRSHTFNEAGTFAYFCTPHPNMHGTVVVRASQTGADTPDSSSGDTGSGATDTGATGAEAAQADDGPSLPSTGTDAAALLILGALMLLLGVAVHRRTA